MEQDLITVRRIDPSKETKLIRIRIQRLWFVPRNDNPDDFYSVQMILCDEENYTVGQNMDDFLCTSHPYRLGFHRYTTVKPCPRLEIPRYGFQFVAFEKINEGAMDLKLLVDVIVQMIGVGELVDISKRSGGNTKRKTIHLRNAKNSILICTLYNVIFVDEWTVGNSFNSTRLLIDSDIDEALEFKKSMLSATRTPMRSLSRIESQSVSTILSELAEESDMKGLNWLELIRVLVIIYFGRGFSSF
ncbi:hypothetical protein OROMI_008016 [Orobanche minor]